MRRKCSGHDITDVTIQTEKENHKFTFISKRSMPETLLGTLANLL